jgi:hypothetical protein
MFALIGIAVIQGAISLDQVPTEADAMQFNAFAQRFNKSYANPTERTYRLKVFKMMLEIIDERNADGALGVHAVNKFSVSARARSSLRHFLWKSSP